jgi:hypothetical protein
MVALYDHQRYGTAARTLAGVCLYRLGPDDALAPLTAVLDSGVDPITDAFLRRYAPGAVVDVRVGELQLELPLGMDLVAVLTVALLARADRLRDIAAVIERIRYPQLAEAVRALDTG